ncbi:MAG: hypothetical protein J7L15_04690 [Clostridiales bacterium]|nr:hypothetical protein [Clostridiales bacterium]
MILKKDYLYSVERGYGTTLEDYIMVVTSIDKINNSDFPVRTTVISGVYDKASGRENGWRLGKLLLNDSYIKIKKIGLKDDYPEYFL